jgi:hypothetical protein
MFENSKVGIPTQKASYQDLKFRLANFVKWSPGPNQDQKTYLVTADGPTVAISAPNYTTAIPCKPVSNQEPGSKYVLPIVSRPRAVGLLSVRDLQNRQPANRCQQQANRSYSFSPIGQRLTAAYRRYDFCGFTGVELIEHASGETFTRKVTPKKRIPSNNLTQIDTDSERTETKRTSQQKKEANLKRFKPGQKMISKGISATGQRKIRLFGRSLHNQAILSNPMVRKKNMVYASHVTLTFPAIYPQKTVTHDVGVDYETGEIYTETSQVPDYKIIKQLFRKFIDALSYRISRDNNNVASKMLYAHVIEEQERGAPHYHILFGHLMPMGEIKAVWAGIVGNWRGAAYSDHEKNACATIKGVRSFSNYLTKYFLKQDMVVPGQCWGLSHAAQNLIRPNVAPVKVFFERTADAYQFLADNATDLISKGCGLFTNMKRAVIDGIDTVLPHLRQYEPKFKPPSVWCHSAKKSWATFETLVNQLIEQDRIAPQLQIQPITARRGRREAVPLYKPNTVLEI